ncbi:MAG: hypothetical protein AB1473_05865 [Thermodesulfobacteriota bacterium]
MDPGTGLTILGGAIGSAKVLEKLLGPTADYLGGEIRNYTEKGFKNLGRIFSHASQTLGTKLEEPGQVPPKVLKGILEEGYFCEDELSAQYFGGVLASSRSEVGRDDRGTSFISLIGRLSAYQIRTHFIFYTVFKGLCHGRRENLGLQHERDKFKVFLPFAVYYQAMDYQQGENPKVLIPHVMDGLSREGLIGINWASGSRDNLNSAARVEVASDGIVFRPSSAGLELYLWAHGLSAMPAKDFLNTDFAPMALNGMTIGEGSECFAPRETQDVTT